MHRHQSQWAAVCGKSVREHNVREPLSQVRPQELAIFVFKNSWYLVSISGPRKPDRIETNVECVSYRRFTDKRRLVVVDRP